MKKLFFIILLFGGFLLVKSQSKSTIIPNNLVVRGSANVQDSTISKYYAYKKITEYPANPSIGMTINYNDTLKRYTGVSWELMKEAPFTRDSVYQYYTDSSLVNSDSLHALEVILLDSINSKLSGTITPYDTIIDASTIYWDVANGANRIDTIDGNRTIVMSNYQNGSTGDIVLYVIDTATLILPVGSRLLGSVISLGIGCYHLTFTVVGEEIHFNIGGSYAIIEE